MKQALFQLIPLKKLLRDAVVRRRGYEIGVIESWQTLQQIGMHEDDFIPIVQEIKATVFDEEPFAIEENDYLRFLGKNSELLKETVDTFLLKLEDLLQFCYVRYVQEQSKR